jgi:hypothetical protein
MHFSDDMSSDQWHRPAATGRLSRRSHLLGGAAATVGVLAGTPDRS